MHLGHDAFNITSRGQKSSPKASWVLEVLEMILNM